MTYEPITVDTALLGAYELFFKIVFDQVFSLVNDRCS